MDPEFERLFGVIEDHTTDLRKKLMTGSIIFRKSNTKAPNDKTNREVSMLIGIVAIPENLNIKDHTQCPLVGTVDKTGTLTIKISLNEGIDRNDQLQGHGLSGIVTAPIWRT